MRYKTDKHLKIETKSNKRQLGYKDIDVGKVLERIGDEKKEVIDNGPIYKVFKDVDNCSHAKYDYERRTTKIYKRIQSENDSNTEIVFRRYKNSRTGKSHYQIVKYFLCSKCNEYRICKGMSAIDLNHKDFKELIDGYIKS